MANISSIGGNPIVPAAVQNDTITDAMLKQTGGVLSEVHDLEDSLNSGAVGIYTDLTGWYNGYIDSRGSLAAADRMISPTNAPVKLNAGDTVIVDAGTLVAGEGRFSYNESTGTYARTYNADHTGTFVISADDGKSAYYSLGFKTSPQADISPSDFDGSIKSYVPWRAQIDSNTSRIVALENDQAAHDVLYGKKLVACGDSITAAVNPGGGNFDNYAKLTADRRGMTFAMNAVSGSTMANVEGKNPFCVNRYLQVTDFDYLTIFFGWNDSAYSTIGTINDTVDTTFYGAYKKVLDHFLTTYPTKKIGLIVPYGPSASIPPFQQAVRDISMAYGVPCLDLANYNECSLLYGLANDAQTARRSALTYDGTHPNQDGHAFMSTMYEQFLLRL